MTSLLEFKRRIGKVLLTWGIANVLVGILLLVGSPGTILAGIGLQAIIWGAIDSFMTYYILRLQKEESVGKILETVSRSIVMDIVFQVVGLIVIISLIEDPYMVGNGLGVILQGFFLLLLDIYYYTSLKKLDNSA